MGKITFQVDNGRLGAEPEIKYTKNDTTVARLSIATNRYKYNDKTKEWEQIGDTSWINGAAFGYTAEQIEMMELKKGDAVFAQGRMEQEIWKDDEGDERISWNFIIDRLYKIPQTFTDEEEDEPKRTKSKSRLKKNSKRKGSSRSSSKRKKFKTRKSSKSKESSSNSVQKILSQLGK